MIIIIIQKVNGAIFILVFLNSGIQLLFIIHRVSPSVPHL